MESTNSEVTLNAMETKEEAYTTTYYKNLTDQKELVISLSRISPQDIAKTINIESLDKISSRGRQIKLRQQLRYESNDTSDTSSNTYSDEEFTPDTKCDFSDSDEEFIPDTKCDFSDSGEEFMPGTKCDADPDDGSVEHPNYTEQLLAYLKNSSAQSVTNTAEKYDLDNIMGEIKYYGDLLGRNDTKSTQFKDVSTLLTSVRKTQQCIANDNKFTYTRTAEINNLPTSFQEGVNGLPLLGFKNAILKQNDAQSTTTSLVPNSLVLEIKKDKQFNEKAKTTVQEETTILKCATNDDKSNNTDHLERKDDPGLSTMVVLLSKLFDDVTKALLTDKSMTPGFNLEDFPGASQLMSRIMNTKDLFEKPMPSTSRSNQKKHASTISGNDNKIKHKSSESDRYQICLLCKHTVERSLFVFHMTKHLQQECMPHCCGICLDIFENGSSLENHMRIIHNLQAIKKSPACDNCARKFLGKCAGKDKSFQIHRIADPEKTHHIIRFLQLPSISYERLPKIFNQTCKCSFCNCSLEDWDQLLTHVSSVHASEISSNFCNFCGRDLHGTEYKYNWTYEIHEYNHKFKEKSTDMEYFQCVVCKLDCSSFYEWSCHMLFHQSPQGVDCHFCGHNSRFVSQLLAHLASHTEKAQIRCQKYRFHCDICNASFSICSERNRHRRRHFSPQFICHVCGKQFFEEGKLTRHINTHLKSSCHICNKSVNAKRINRHLELHKKSYKKCSKCHISFTTQKRLDKHYDTIHLKKNFKCVCEYCGAGFARKQSMIVHINRHHTKKKNFKCDLCDKAYFTINGLKLHTRTHTGERPFHCTHCPKAFASSFNLTDHIRIHTGEKPFKCPVCDKAFTKSCNMKKHVKLMHSTKATKSN